MKRLLLLWPIMFLLGVLLCPTFAGGRHEGRHPGFSGRHDHFEFNHERHEGWRGNHGRFNGFGGVFYGQIINLDDGCYFWNGLAWETTECN